MGERGGDNVSKILLSLYFFISKYSNIIFAFYCFLFIVKLQSKVQTSVLGLGVDFVLPLSQQQQQQQQEPHQNIPEGNILEVLNLQKASTNQTKPTKPNQSHLM